MHRTSILSVGRVSAAPAAIAAIAVTASLGTTAAAAAASGIPTLECWEDLPFSAPVVQDYLVPNRPGAFLDLFCSGADGGYAYAGGNCDADGGQGATAIGRFAIGFGPGELAPGTRLRFMVGQRGEDGHDSGGFSGCAGGGGGGTGVLFEDAAGDWIPLVVAGGGGGGRQTVTFGFCNPPDGNAEKHGLPGSTDQCGTTWAMFDPPGCDGLAGFSGNVNWPCGGGGGLYEAAGGPAGGGAAIPGGGAGGPGADGEAGGDGGWGCGGGGGGDGEQENYRTTGGAGGGYSGGGVSSLEGGGGGGSFVAETALATSITEGSPGAANGYITYRVVEANFIAEDAHAIEPGVPVEQCFFRFDEPGLVLACPSDPRLSTLWWYYENASEFDRTYRFVISSSFGSNVAGSVREPGDINTPLVCIGSGGIAEFTIPAGETRFFLARAEILTTVELVDTTVDSDGDGVPDDVDVCPGFDDAIDTDGDGIPDGCECPGDFDGSGVVDFGDLVILLSTWGVCESCDADVVPDGVVNFDDLLYVLSYWGGCGA